MPTDRLGQMFDAGPFPAVRVEPFPPELVAQVERLTGKRFDEGMLQTYERVRAFLDYQGVQLTPQLRAEQVLVEPAPEHTSPTQAPEARPARAAERTAAQAALGRFDPQDLGD